MSERAYEGWVIRHHFLGGNLFGGEGEEGIDREGSVRRYAELCREALVENYPGADIQVTYDSPNVQGSGGRTEVVPAGEDPESFQQAEAEKDGLDAILSRVFEDGNWYVEKRYGLQEFAQAVGMDPRRLSVERGRGKVPTPEFELACGPVWTHDQVQAFKEKLAGEAAARQARGRMEAWHFATAEGCLTEHDSHVIRQGETLTLHGECFRGAPRILDALKGAPSPVVVWVEFTRRDVSQDARFCKTDITALCDPQDIATTLHEAACDWAELALWGVALAIRVQPDPASLEAVRIRRAWLRGEATDSECEIAKQTISRDIPCLPLSRSAETAAMCAAAAAASGGPVGCAIVAAGSAASAAEWACTSGDAQRTIARAAVRDYLNADLEQRVRAVLGMHE